ncbi:MAG TPA: rod shape-determining protein MreD, partial [Nitrospiria bacterium]|nr:rod shape-determining protein MreD [Nitrospiria bacterium]
MNPWFFAAALLFLIPLQTTLMDLVSINGVKPDLGFLFVYFTGFFLGIRKGMLCGAGIGLLYDLFSGGPFGMNLAAKASAGLGAGILGRFFINTGGPAKMGLILGLSVFSGVVAFLFHQATWGGWELGHVFQWTILPESLYNSILGGLVYWLASGRMGLRPRTETF